MATRIAFRERLDFRLTIACLVCALVVGGVLSGVRIVSDARRQDQEIGRTAEQILTMMRQPAAEAAYNIDSALAARVLDGLTRYEAVTSAAVVVAPGKELARVSRPPAASRGRALTDAIFGAARQYRIPLHAGGFADPVGELRVEIDTCPAGRAFLDRARVEVVTGLLTSVILALVLLGIFFLRLTRPLARLVQTLSHVDPRAPQRTRLPAIPGHARDELGVWVGSANALLQSIEDHIAGREQAEAQANYLEQFDRLTDLPNRTLFYDRLDQEIHRVRRDRHGLAVLCCDVRDFQYVNDKYGHEAGDAVLRGVAARLKRAVGERATVARLAGDRFAVFVGGLERETAVADLPQKVLDRLREPFHVGAHSIGVSLSIGVASFPDDGAQAEPLVRNAEKAMAMAKGGPGPVCFYVADLGERFRVRREMVHDLRTALERQQLELHYHPQFAAESAELVGVEALLRWRHPERGLVPTAQFIPLAEESGAIVDIGRWVIGEACRQARAWTDAGLPPLRVAVNVSTHQLHGADMASFLERQLGATGLPPQRLDLEVTETAVMAQIDRAVDTLRDLRALGVRISVDDFGTGQSSLSYLLRLPVHALKIDRSFVHGMIAGAEGGHVVSAIIGLAHSLRLAVIAEGVETAAQVEQLRALRCDELQGFYFTRPLPAAEFEDFARRVPILPDEQRRLFTVTGTRH